MGERYGTQSNGHEPEIWWEKAVKGGKGEMKSEGKANGESKWLGI